MNAPVASAPLASRTPLAPQGPQLRPVRDGYWRVSAASGLLLGYVEQEAAEPARFVAKRLLASTRVVAIGEFGSAAEAVEALR